MDIEELKAHAISRRSALKWTAGTAAFLAQAAMLEGIAITPARTANAAAFSDIQFDIGQFINPAQILNDGAGNVTVQFGPVFAMFLPARLNRTPTKADQTTLANALAAIEAAYPASPSGMLIASISYGIPYFNRLPGGLNGTLVSSHMPRLSSNTSRFVLEEAVPSPTDVVGGLVGGPNAPIPGVTKDRFNVNVVIENNDVVFHFRSDSMVNLAAIPLWFNGSNNLNGKGVPSPNFNGLFSFQTQRIQFTQVGMPRTVANNNGFEFAPRMNPDSPMNMGFTDQQTNASGSPAIVTFVGNSSAKITNANPGDYFDNGSIMHLSHNIEDLYQFYSTPNQDSRHPDGESFQERVQYMFRSNQLGTSNGLPATGNADQFTNGGGPAHINNVFQGTNAAQLGAQDSAGTFTSSNQSLSATFTGLGRIGHEAALQRLSRAADGTPMHIRNDGPGFDSMDVPAFQLFPGQGTFAPGSQQFKLQFAVFMPTADLFQRMRVAVAAQDFQAQFGVDPDDNGLERFITATRRQNFLVPPRRHRAFPLLELT
jgi:hypothetical protein